MTNRHVFTDHSSLVLRSITGLVNSQPNLSAITSIKTVINANHDENKVSLICGGGSGHEPGSTGFVGRGLLSASVCGDVFASPSARQVYGAMKAVPSKKGTLLIITNCTLFFFDWCRLKLNNDATDTGDNLHFGLACQQARADGAQNVDILPVGDDFSVGRTKGALVGRRALAGTIFGQLRSLCFENVYQYYTQYAKYLVRRPKPIGLSTTCANLVLASPVPLLQ